jgi:hypothetical protein
MVQGSVPELAEQEPSRYRYFPRSMPRAGEMDQGFGYSGDEEAESGQQGSNSPIPTTLPAPVNLFLGVRRAFDHDDGFGLRSMRGDLLAKGTDL